MLYHDQLTAILRLQIRSSPVAPCWILHHLVDNHFIEFAIHRERRLFRKSKSRVILAKVNQTFVQNIANQTQLP